jgi:hypothetical protein
MSDLHTQIAPHTAVSGLASKNDRPQLCARKNLLTFVRSPGLSSRLQSYYRLFERYKVKNVAQVNIIKTK